MMKNKILFLLLCTIYSSHLMSQFQINGKYEMDLLAKATYQYFESYKIEKKSNINLFKESEDIIRFALAVKEDKKDLLKLFSEEVSDSIIYFPFEYYFDNFGKFDVYLLYRLTFELEGTPIAYYQIKEVKEGRFFKIRTIVTYYQNERWYLRDAYQKKPHLSDDIETVLSSIRPKLFYALLSDTMPDSPSLLNEVWMQTRFNGGFDIDLFAKLRHNWFREREKEKLDFFFYSLEERGLRNAE